MKRGELERGEGETRIVSPGGAVIRGGLTTLCKKLLGQFCGSVSWFDTLLQLKPKRMNKETSTSLQ